MKDNSTFRIPPILSVGPVSALIFFFGVIPIGIIIVYTFLEAHVYGGVKPVFTFDAYIQMFFERDLDESLIFDSAYLMIFFRSVVLGLLATLISLVVSFPVAYQMSRQKESTRKLLLLLITIPFWTNMLVRIFCWVLLLRDTGLVNNFLLWTGIIDSPIRLMYTNGAILVGLVYTYIPFMVLPIYTSMEKLDKNLIEASFDLYANRIKTLISVVLPLTKSGIIAGCTLVFIPSLGAYIAPNLLGGGKHMMLGNLVQVQFTTARNWPFGSVCAVLLLASIMIVLLISAKKGKAKEVTL